MHTFVFDLYNTLIDVHTDEHRVETWTPVVRYFAAHGMKRTDERALCRDYDRYWKLFYERAQAERVYRYPECDAVSVFESMARAAGGRLSREQAAEALKIMRKASVVHMRLFDGTVELLTELRTRGAKLYLLSNAQAAFTCDEIDEFSLAGYFDGILLSSEHGCRKPDRSFFELLTKEFDVDTASAVMVGDDMENDVRGAESVGMTAVWAGGGAAAHRDEIIAMLNGGNDR